MASPIKSRTLWVAAGGRPAYGAAELNHGGVWNVLDLQLHRRARLQLEGEPNSAAFVVRQTAIFDPAELAEVIDWHTVFPLHKVIFAGPPRTIATAAEEKVCLNHADRVA